MTDVQRFSKLIKDIPFVMLTTINNDDETLRSRPMTLQKAEFEGDLWFFAARTSPACLDIEENPKVNLAFAEPKDTAFVSATGIAEVVFDKEKATELWNPIYKAWFPEGLEDPELCLIRVVVESADYWDAPSSKVVQGIGSHGHLS